MASTTPTGRLHAPGDSHTLAPTSASTVTPQDAPDHATDKVGKERDVLRQLVKKCTLPASFLRNESNDLLVAAMRSAPLYAVSVEASLVEALELVREARAQVEVGSIEVSRAA